MVLLRKKEIKDGIVTYYYQPEGKGDWGELYYNSNNGQCGYYFLAGNDDISDSKYRNHAYSHLMEFVKKNQFPEESIRAWG